MNTQASAASKARRSPDGDRGTGSAISIGEAMRRAISLARRGPEHGPNPRVGCVLLAPGHLAGRGGDTALRTVIGEGHHRGAGTPHAEVAALADARRRGFDVRGCTAVVTLEPCRHTGRTGPCTDALIRAGAAEVVYGARDPDPIAGGGGALLRRHGVRVRSGVASGEAEDLIRVWAASIRAGRPFVSLKLAMSLDGRIAAADGSSKWLTSTASRAAAHRLRGRVGAVLVGMGTVLADDPRLTARNEAQRPAGHQPLRVALGRRAVPVSARIRSSPGEFLQIPHRDPRAALDLLRDRGVRHVLVEGGARVASAFLREALVDELELHIAPLLLGSGVGAVERLGVETLSDADRWRLGAIERSGADLLVRAVPAPGNAGRTPPNPSVNR
ncbi:bifunctional diaminohydroxyphosphoribosylaminopyrimidine deaminase/5-amino-6-(5-phosphoribosylamino)uracil reductase RibD [Gulosibacter sp. 10]|uniref:bifunctional diaminohydroxyphosphoribosylaminopyrimidine deaminase/5-amino-6-(5-phosphoribosylamino)uracil reductase RibD n=1 Tax=Gulosibacter sp. 10 TaxID=1255570 RepID=UPI00097F5D9C|nr:bifunctional diaminohydroxyphosphoribosylaminopyrimidine deaminase/5-amino-6-(5-phosphoribosylamino)uracil reductase RibD [Gulosibacter sp. 10]SJM66593.1 Diaminohydroxyphosphoribosylaminopyrimidine deaminase / 5-amino-6-(5-phosphoribosylamino)uracil reductase [Gulosibacter sp. 10]